VEEESVSEFTKDGDTLLGRLRASITGFFGSFGRASHW